MAANAIFTSVKTKLGGYVTCLLERQKHGLTITATDGSLAFYRKMSREEIESCKLNHVKMSGSDWHDLFWKAMCHDATEDMLVEAAVEEGHIQFVLLDRSADSRIKMAAFTVDQASIEIDLQDWLHQSTQSLDQRRQALLAKEKQLLEAQEALKQCRREAASQADAFAQQSTRTLELTCLLLNAKKDKIKELSGAGKAPGTGQKRAKVESPTEAIDLKEEEGNDVEEMSDMQRTPSHDDDATTDGTTDGE
ncbi:hypothetical protein BCR37DRAFT_389883 [Protomyces lactucae-debilis]|uniref:Uncharacterized protein n=1 Tax=Protomyces lactucae-debilis TaxID=2754530 RepID=A0A1Y2ESS5_PROLT|nr:uncharacterized protein BCR37DRAFT_389883 [Protomyces lactucae-debilis]ORY74334.1 hypothetical protein BCR37DRAFT_389883 [Protomyces lactucae-debilis]